LNAELDNAENKKKRSKKSEPSVSTELAEGASTKNGKVVFIETNVVVKRKKKAGNSLFWPPNCPSKWPFAFSLQIVRANGHSLFRMKLSSQLTKQSQCNQRFQR
jgi:hypothetical protein